MNKTEQITFKISERQKKLIKLQAEKKGMSVAEYVRFVVMRDIENDNSVNG
jgi:uncharacterized protein (DUF1778 family)